MFKRLKLSLPFLFVFASGCATAPAPQAICPTTVAGYVAGEATSNLVKSCMGQPEHEDHNPDGRYVYLYRPDIHTIMSFLFDSKGKLIRTRGYHQN